MEKERRITFTFSGEVVTNLAREMLYERNNLVGAVELLMASTETNELSEGDHLKIAIDILDGKKEIVGTYPGEDYGVIECAPGQEKTVKGWLNELIEENEKLKIEKAELLRKFACVTEDMSVFQKREANQRWREEYSFDEDDLFEFEEDAFEDPDGNEVRLEDTLDHKEDDYGWLSPEGKFYPAPWGDHERMALDIVKKYGYEHDFFNRMFAGDFLTEKGWVLLHNPSNGIAYPTTAEGYDMTKAQKDFLFDYYRERNRPDYIKKYVKY